MAPPTLEGKGSHIGINLGTILVPILYKGDDTNSSDLIGC